MREARRSPIARTMGKPHDKADAAFCRNPFGDGTFRAARFVAASLVWNDHTALAASCDPSRKARVAAAEDLIRDSLDPMRMDETQEGTDDQQQKQDQRQADA